MAAMDDAQLMLADSIRAGMEAFDAGLREGRAIERRATAARIREAVAEVDSGDIHASVAMMTALLAELAGAG